MIHMGRLRPYSKTKPRHERPARDKKSSLLGSFVNYGENIIAWKYKTSQIKLDSDKHASLFSINISEERKSFITSTPAR